MVLFPITSEIINFLAYYNITDTFKGDDLLFFIENMGDRVTKNIPWSSKYDKTLQIIKDAIKPFESKRQSQISLDTPIKGIVVKYDDYFEGALNMKIPCDGKLCATLSPNRIILTQNHNKDLQVWDISTKKLETTINTQQLEYRYPTVLSEDKILIITPSYYEIWSISSQICETRIFYDKNRFIKAKLLGNNEIVMFYTTDAEIINLKTHKIRTTLEYTNVPYVMEDKFILCKDNCLIIWDPVNDTYVNLGHLPENYEIENIDNKKVLLYKRVNGDDIFLIFDTKTKTCSKEIILHGISEPNYYCLEGDLIIGIDDDCTTRWNFEGQKILTDSTEIHLGHNFLYVQGRCFLHNIEHVRNSKGINKKILILSDTFLFIFM